MSVAVPELLALVELTHPGPFRTRTIELGRYIGMRRHGRFVAYLSVGFVPRIELSLLYARRIA